MQLGRLPTKKRPRKAKSHKPMRVRSKEHLDFVRGQQCLVNDCTAIDIEAHHIGDTATAAMSLKSDDDKTVPLCRAHHKWLHDHGAQNAENVLNLDLREAALWFARRSPDSAIREAGAEHG